MKSLRAQLAWRLLIGGALLLGLAGAVAYWQMRRALVAEADAALRAMAQSIAALVEQKNGRVSLEIPSASLPQFDRPDGTDVYVLRAAEGAEIARSASLGKSVLPAGEGTMDAPGCADVTLTDGRAFRCASLHFTPPEEDEDEHPARFQKVGTVLVVGRDRAPLEHTLALLRVSLLLAGAAALGLLAALAHWGIRRGLAPVSALGEQVSAIDAASLGNRLAVDPLPQELQPIALRLNALLERLEAAFARERRFTATAAHELRTPLAELRALAEVNLTTPATESERSESWRDALATILRMESLALRLLDLARAEHGDRAVARCAVPLGAALAAAWQPWQRRAAERGVSLEAALPPELTALANVEILDIVLGNLCANAAEYAARQTPLRVQAVTENGTVRAHFRNRVENLTAADLPHLFERFWRKDESRSDGRRHGLGLALASEFAELMGATLSAKMSGDHDVEFELSLPRT